MTSKDDHRSSSDFLREHGKLPLVVCPTCHYGFLDNGKPGTRYTCPRPECGAQWEAATETMAGVHGYERRQPNPEIHIKAGLTARTFPLPDGDVLVGRDTTCQLQLENPTVSRQHARLVRKNDQVWIANLSKSGTLVNGQALQSQTLLMVGDEVRLASVTLVYAVRYEASDSGRALMDSAALLSRPGRAAPRMNGVTASVIPLGQARISFGRGSDRTVVLPDSLISRRHAVLEPQADGFYLGDVQSRIGTYVNGKSIVRVRLSPGDRIQLGPYVFRFEGQQLRYIQQPNGLAVEAVELSQSAGTIQLLDAITLRLEAGEFVGLLGPSGAGKTTLLDALNGMRPARSGEVLVNDEPLYEQYDRLRHLIGYVPQDDIIHRELTSTEALRYAGRLRLPDLSDDELEKVINDTLLSLGMANRSDVPIHRLSGGQRKRVSVGVEMLSQPGILFLDEPTSGLDPSTESRLMRQFRELADQGRTVVCTTHVMENVDLFHKVAVLAPGGRLAYFGPPVEAKTYFLIDRFTALYEVLEEKKPEEWKERFRRNKLQQVGPPSLTVSRPRETASGGRLAPAPVSSALRQWHILTRRFTRIVGSDRANLILLGAQPLVIAGLICVVCNEMPLIYFLLVISALWFGCSNAAQQIVKERAIYRRERMVNLRLDAYVLSKFLPLAGISAVQCLLMLLLVWLFKGRDGSGLVQTIALALAAWNGVALGLVISALASNADKAMSVVPLTLIPQIILAGVLVPLPDMNGPTLVAADLMASRWANQAIELSLMQGQAINEELLSKETNVRPLWNLYPDANLRTLEGRQHFMQEHQDMKVDRVTAALNSFAVLSVLLIVLLLAVVVILRRQDVF
jgi:ABC-type multidrug transport system ATPase subunit